MYFKVPIGLTAFSPSQVRLYIAFVDFKLFNAEGVIDPKTFRRCDKEYYTRWINKLVEAGWAVRKGNVIHLRAYQHVWRLLGVKPSYNKKRGYHYKYIKIATEGLSMDRRTYTREIRDILYRTHIMRKVKQVKYQALKNAGRGRKAPTKKSTSNLKIHLTATQVSNWFGNSVSRSTGLKLRRKFLPEIVQPKGYTVFDRKIRREMGYMLI